MGLRVFILDQERTFADALAARLEAEVDVAVVAAVSVKPPALRPVVAKHTDIVLLDGDLPGGAAFTFCQDVSGRGEAPHVIMMSYSSEAERIVAAVRGGATAWVRKDESLEHLLQVIRGVARGETWLPPAVTGQVLRLLLREREQQRERERLLAALTPREREVLACLADGAGRREAAVRLRLSANTVRTHLQNLMTKLRVHSTLEAVALIRPELDRVSNRRGAGW
ncbi:MAG TPA: response regulator transcription factor [Streptosporangiaceae bacterium]|nr:response regulator transcription factor [Streptosporangiaceae bacterium]